ncbi:MAG: ABC transporter substrate-binding protein [Thermodesulfobacteriota bacterium]
MVRKVIITLSLLILSLLPAGCNRQETVLPTVRIGHVPHDHHSALYIAASNPEFFRANGNLYLEEITPRKKYRLMAGNRPQAMIILTPASDCRDLIKNLGEGRLDLAFGSITTNLHFIDLGQPLKIAAPIMAEGASLVMSKNFPAGNWAEFVSYAKARQEPIRIGYKVNFSHNLILENALQHSGLSFSKQIDQPGSEITLINLHGARNLLPALQRRLIDGFVVDQPYSSLAEFQNIGKTIVELHELPPENYWQNHPCCVVSIHNNFYGQQPEVSQQLITLFLRANRYIQTNRDESILQVAKWLELPVEVEKKSIPTIMFKTGYDNDWKRGVDFLISSLINGEKLNNLVKKAYEKNRADELIYQLDLFEQASKEI